MGCLLISGITLCYSNECIIQVEQLGTAEYHENGKCPELDNKVAQPGLIFTVIFFGSGLNCDVVNHIDEDVSTQEICTFFCHLPRFIKTPREFLFHNVLFPLFRPIP